MMFLAHFSGDGISSVLEMSLSDIYYWFNEALKLHEKMNPTQED